MKRAPDELLSVAVMVIIPLILAAILMSLSFAWRASPAPSAETRIDPQQVSLQVTLVKNEKQ